MNALFEIYKCCKRIVTHSEMIATCDKKEPVFTALQAEIAIDLEVLRTLMERFDAAK